MQLNPLVEKKNTPLLILRYNTVSFFFLQPFFPADVFLPEAPPKPTLLS